MPVNRIVLDTNWLLAILSRRGNYFSVWQGLHEGKYTLCVSNEILEEYEEIICSKTNPIIASNVIQMLINSPYVQFVDTYFHFHLIEQDKDDNKFVDCAIVTNARYIVTEDKHFDILRSISFPVVEVKDIDAFLKILSVY